MESSSASTNHLVLLAASAFGVTAAMLAISIPILQTDLISRTWLLSSRKLQAKRNAQYLYRWKWALEKTLYYLFHVYFPDLQESHVVEWYATEKELTDFVQEIVNPHQPTPRLLWVGVDVDQDDPRGEYYLYLLQQHSASSTGGRTIIKVPLVAFGLKLQEAMEAMVTTTTLCFIADASSGLGTRWITGLLESCQVGVTLFKEPLWMATLAYLAQQRLVSTEKLQKIMFGLCRLEAWRLRDKLGDAKTAVFTLPGQGAVPILLPLVQAAFPEDRHVFCYDGCVASVERAVSFGQSPSLQPTSSVSSSQKLLPKLDTLLEWSYHPSVSIGTPIHPTKLPSALPSWTDASRKLPLQLSSAVHAWMDSVDTFLQLKTTSNSNKSSSQLQQYLPYVCKMSLLLPPSPDNSNSSATITQEVSYSLSSLLQYITGFHFKSRPLPPQVWEAAIDYWRNNNHASTTHGASSVHVSTAYHRAIEDCVFRHKSILIGDKTLLDTVLPAQHWTLIQASKKSSCACCAPDEDDEEEENDNNKSATSSDPFAANDGESTENGSRNGLVQRRPKFVDGKMGFAFDPTAFTKM